MFGILQWSASQWSNLLRPLVAAEAREKIEALIGALEMDGLPYLARFLAKLGRWLHSTAAAQAVASGK